MIIELPMVMSRHELEDKLKQQGLRPVTSKDNFRLLLDSTRVF